MELNSLPTSRHIYQKLYDELDPLSVGDGSESGPAALPDHMNGNVHAQQLTEPFDPLDQ